MNGLAYPTDDNTATCSSINFMNFSGNTISSPYSCDPSDQTKFCQLFFNIAPNDANPTAPY